MKLFTALEVALYSTLGVLVSMFLFNGFLNYPIHLADVLGAGFIMYAVTIGGYYSLRSLEPTPMTTKWCKLMEKNEYSVFLFSGAVVFTTLVLALLMVVQNSV